MGPARQFTAHKCSGIWQIQVKTFTFTLFFWRKKRLLIASSLQPPPGSSNLVFTSLVPPAGLQDGVGQGRPPTWTTSCPPTSYTSSCPVDSVHPQSSHLVPPVHQYGPLGNIDPLQVQGVGVAPSGAHSVDNVHPPLMMMERVEPKNRFLLISDFQIVQMLSSPSVAISPALPLVRTNSRPTFLAPEFITNTFSPAISSFLHIHTLQASKDKSCSFTVKDVLCFSWLVLTYLVSSSRVSIGKHRSFTALTPWPYKVYRKYHKNQGCVQGRKIMADIWWKCVHLLSRLVMVSLKVIHRTAAALDLVLICPRPSSGMRERLANKGKNSTPTHYAVEEYWIWWTEQFGSQQNYEQTNLRKLIKI